MGGSMGNRSGVPARRLVLVSTNYAPERAGIGPYAAQLAEHWAARDDLDVHVLAGMPHYPAWRTDPAYRGSWRVTEDRAGVRVHRRRHTVPARQSALRRALYEASILGHGLLAPPRTGGAPDIVVAQLPSLAGGVLAARMARAAKAPFIPVVQDLMGAAAAQSGIRGGDRAAALAASVERRVLASATLVGVIHESFVERVTALGVPRSRVRTVPNWSHIAGPTRPRAETRARLGWAEDETVVLHSGNMGLKQGLEVLVETARLDPTLRVVLMGDGNQRRQLAALAASLPNATLMPPAPEAEFPDVLAAADVLAVTQRASVLDMSVPSKLTSYFAAGRPVIASVAEGGGTAEELRRAGAALLVPPEDPRALADGVRALAADPAHATALGETGRAYATERLGSAAGLARLTALLDEALDEAPTRPTAARRNASGPRGARV
ncbi:MULTISPECIES: glycosyltransferase family 4 protein [unclassified Streptomyces]|uniref:glycosyltransferase family 4 protein n=1 Tax=unclassified Streptomyces TaxID=2593676 RepID=UPI002DDBBDC6|nr:glycosyltransferase family 4 protein [Streptomyces sp. NBC_01795]WSA95089.1 glycosyltransferase family 4 protein [Streptomyces sp. NBC_01795]WSS40999.1 glycosyltransferase family 4 protein [Streptomyces sp. NBC_01187]